MCSLRPGKDRLVLSCIMMIDAQGEILSYEVTQGVIRSISRMTYTQVHDVIRGNSNTREQFAPLVPEFERMYELARLLHKKRQRRGSIDFDLPEPVIEFDARGAMQSIVRSERSWANRLIEEFMLSANECVASWLQNLDVPSLYRIHEKPEPRKVAEFEDVAARFGYSLGLGSLPVKRVTMKSERREQRSRGAGRVHQPRQYEIAEDIAVTPRMYQQLALKIAGKPEERILAHLMLRSLRQARYSERNEGHFALAAPCYTHFTSPIRRYPDLIVHRILKTVLRGDVGSAGLSRTVVPTRTSVSDERPSPWSKRRDHAAHREALEPLGGPISIDELHDIAEESSQAERRADDAERDLMEWKKVKFMQDRVGDDFDGLITSVTKFGFFVELTDLFVEGLVPLNTLVDDRYVYHESTREIIGQRSRKTYRLGQRIHVLVDRIDPVEKKIQFAIFEQPQPLPTLSRSSSKPQRKSKRKGRQK